VDLIRINDPVFPKDHVGQKIREVLMPFDALIVSLAVTVVFVGFAAVLAWADRRTRPAQADAPAQKRRSF
jgi:hypothetical protein